MSLYRAMALQLQNLDFEVLVQAIELMENAELQLLPYVEHVVSEKMTDVDHRLLRLCCRATKVKFPACRNLTNADIVCLPYIESLTINAVNGLNNDIFRHLSYLKHLQILSQSEFEPDLLLDHRTMFYLQNLESLHVYTNTLVNEDFLPLKHLKILVLCCSDEFKSTLNANLLNYLPQLELFVFNDVVYRFKATQENTAILKKLGTVKIY